MGAKFGNYLRKLRTNAGFSITTLGEKLGVTGASVSTIELGNQNPTAKFIVKASKILKVPLQELVDLQNEDLYGLTKAAEIEDLLTSTDVLRHIEKTKSILGEAILRLQFCEERLMDDKKSQPEIK